MFVVKAAFIRKQADNNVTEQHKNRSSSSSSSMPKVKKHKSVLAAKQSISKPAATGNTHKNPNPKQKPPPPQQQSGRSSKPAPAKPKAPRAVHAAAWPHGSWRCASIIDQQSAEALHRLLSAAETRTAGATIKSLTLAPHIVHKKPTYAVTVETLKHLPLLKAVLTAVGLQHKQVCYDAIRAAAASLTMSHATQGACVTVRPLPCSWHSRGATAEQQQQQSGMFEFTVLQLLHVMAHLDHASWQCHLHQCCHY
jgi:hypothetical protein